MFFTQVCRVFGLGRLYPCLPYGSWGQSSSAAGIQTSLFVHFVTAPEKQLLGRAELRCRVFSPGFWEGEKQTMEIWSLRRAARYAGPAGAGCRLGKSVRSRSLYIGATWKLSSQEQSQGIYQGLLLVAEELG